MHCLDVTLTTPEENLACDEALVDEAELHGGPPVLRFWESPTYFVVVGYSNRIFEEVKVEECRAQKIPILRRCSGGGTVLQGPGCLNYSVVLPIDDAGPTATITRTNSYVMERNRQAVASALAQKVSIQGCTDLAMNQLKFSGNAQRRKRGWLLFHGTFLLDFEVGLIEKLLPMPARQPDYRRQRSHGEFLTHLSATRDGVKASLVEVWGASARREGLPRAAIDRLISEKYGNGDWIFRW
jgi:lipoate---protein ligase